LILNVYSGNPNSKKKHETKKEETRKTVKCVNCEHA
jgi:hypothetical protein